MPREEGNKSLDYSCRGRNVTCHRITHVTYCDEEIFNNLASHRHPPAATTLQHQPLAALQVKMTQPFDQTTLERHLVDTSAAFNEALNVASWNALVTVYNEAVSHWATLTPH